MKLTHIFIGILLLFFAVPTHAQWGKKIKGNGNVTQENREVGAYEKISIDGNIGVVLVEGKEGDIILQAEDNLIKYIEVRVVNGALRIKSKDRTELRPSKGNQILVTVPIQEVNKISLNGSGEVKGTQTLKSNEIKLQINGSGDMYIDVSANEVKAAINGSGDITVTGKTDIFEATVTGSGDIEGYGLVANTCNAKVIGSGDIECNAKQKLNAKIIGSGDIQINKSVVTIEKKIIGSGDVSKR